MKKVLLIGTESREVEALADRLQTLKAQIRVAPGGLYALTLLERDRPDLILTVADLGDMSAVELCTLAKRDLSLSKIQIVLLARTLEEKLFGERQGDFDLILLDDRPLDALADRLQRLITQGVLAPSDNPLLTRAIREHRLSGSLGVMSFAELIQALGQTDKTGRLILESEENRGSVLFADGMIQHATFRNSEGASAFAGLFHEAERATRMAFRFEPLTEQQMHGLPTTIGRAARSLLLSAAVDLSENTTTEMVTAGVKDWLRREEDH